MLVLEPFRGVLQKGYSDFPQVFYSTAILKNFTLYKKTPAMESYFR